MGANEQGAAHTAGRWLTIPRTLSFITHGADVLLLKRGVHKRIFPGRYNGVGGHIERDEDPYRSTLREIHEETGLTVTDLRLRGVTHIDAGDETGIMLFVFTAEATSRSFTDSDEGTLHWVPLSALAPLPLVEDLPLLIPRLFGATATDALFFAHVHYDADDLIVMHFADE